MHKRACEAPPAPKHDAMWSTFDVPQADRETQSQTAK